MADQVAVDRIFPPGAYARWRDFRHRRFRGKPQGWVLAACGVLFGAVTHLVWDAFTHEGARGVRMFPALEDPVVEVGGHRLAGAHLLQDAIRWSGLIVVIAILAYGLRRGTARPMPAAVRPGERRWAWICAYFADGRRSEQLVFPGARMPPRPVMPAFPGGQRRRDRRVARPGRSAHRNAACCTNGCALRRYRSA